MKMLVLLRKRKGMMSKCKKWRRKRSRRKLKKRKNIEIGTKNTETEKATNNCQTAGT